MFNRDAKSKFYLMNILFNFHVNIQLPKSIVVKGTVLFFIIMFYCVGLTLGQSVNLKGINCKLEPQYPAYEFQPPLKPIEGKEWIISNEFGNIVTNEDVQGLPSGYWQHTGIDYLLKGNSKNSANQTVYAVANGVVVYTTSLENNPLPKRGGLIVIRHIAPPGKPFQIPSYKKNFSIGKSVASVSHNLIETNEIFSYYLHLNPADVEVKQGDYVSVGQRIGRLYSYEDYAGNKFVYAPHLHFEIWVKCNQIERNGYDPPGSGKDDFGNAVAEPIVDPLPLLQQFPTWLQLTVGDRKEGFYLSPDKKLNYKDQLLKNLNVSSSVTTIEISPFSTNKNYAVCLVYDEVQSKKYLLNLEKRTAILLDLPELPSLILASWSPDGTHLVIGTYYESDSRLYEVTLSPYKMRQIPINLEIKNNRQGFPIEAQVFDVEAINWVNPYVFVVPGIVNCNPYNDESDCDPNRWAVVLRKYLIKVNAVTLKVDLERKK